MVRDIKVVIGASYGDEGKGFMTNYFCRNADKPCITVLHNGGSQRGHTVISKDGLRHVFHHLSSGTFSGSDTYFADSFIINPLVFADEYSKLNPKTKIYCSIDCMWSTPFDMMLNQIIEDSRGDSRHGSCGYGIWETIVRYKNSDTMPFRDFMFLNAGSKTAYLKKIREKYMPERLKSAGIYRIPEKWQDIIQNDNLITGFINDCIFFDSSIIYSDTGVLENYPCVIFEGGQGLLLSQSETNPHTTPSYTGAENPVRIIKTLNGTNNIEVSYVTRSYLTRHGAGGFSHECTKAEINPDMTDKTNVPNDYQGAIRYGKINIPELRQRIMNDFTKFSGFENMVLSVAVTHLNETDGKLVTSDGMENPENIGTENMYKFYSEINILI